MDPNVSPIIMMKNYEKKLVQDKRKGGRKPIYTSSQERKKRNRQAQAAFRERRIEYIKQLEGTVMSHEIKMHSLNIVNRNSMEECLMLRSHNSSLMNILQERDVHAELLARTQNPHLSPDSSSLVSPLYVPGDLVQTSKAQPVIISDTLNQAPQFDSNSSYDFLPDISLPSQNSSKISSPPTSLQSSYPMEDFSGPSMTSPILYSQFECLQPNFQSITPTQQTCGFDQGSGLGIEFSSPETDRPIESKEHKYNTYVHVFENQGLPINHRQDQRELNLQRACHEQLRDPNKIQYQPKLLSFLPLAERSTEVYNTTSQAFNPYNDMPIVEYQCLSGH
ncbi:hypothetical protein GcC1_193010 [Golovinomyces cichoracearum]|uniref:BZIP domain-containing protein n=1 Tax=Golovinomyces cichoracearum TaxID=62708 RepID=A0A420HH72_9PEZI|nr:hypothetical protein GcC1_193010 [Golovinomyces cichoracearum]